MTLFWILFSLYAMGLLSRYMLVGFFWLMLVHSADAQEYTEVTALNFGTFGMRDNDNQYSIVLGYDNSVTYDPEIADNPDFPPQRGQYDFIDLPPNVTFYVGVSVPNPPVSGGLILDNSSGLTFGGGVFTLENFTANDLTTDGNGDGTLYIGATLKTSGNGTMYSDGVYSGTYDLTLYF
jgi:hypothetical protein